LITVRSPLRISFVGGPSDLPAYCHTREGHVVSAAIDRYVYLSVSPRHSGIRLSYSITENVDYVDDLKHDIVRYGIKFTGVIHRGSGIEIVSMADIDSGAGLGSSGAFTCALVKNFYAQRGLYTSKLETYKSASLIEMHLCNKPIGYQDQAASAFGGIGFYTFYNDTMYRDDLSFSPYVDELFNHLLVVDTGLRGSSSDVLSDQSANINIELTQRMSEAAITFRNMLMEGQILRCGYILDECWNIKKLMNAHISNQHIDTIYDVAMSNGACGGKLCGAGGRGMMIFISEPGKLRSLASSLSETLGLRSFVPHLSISGTEIVYSS